MFNLIRHFSLTSAAAMAVATFILVAAFRYHEMDEYIERVEAENTRVAEVFANVFLREFDPLLQSLSATATEDLPNHREVRALDIVLRSLTSAMPVQKIKIYDGRGRVIFSPVHEDIGRTSESPATLAMALGGKTASSVTTRPAFTGWNGTLVGHTLVATYTPVRISGGKSIGVFELDTDITDETSGLYESLGGAAMTAAATFLGLYCTLFLVVRRAHRILHAQQRDLEAGKSEYRSQQMTLRSLLDGVGEGVYGMDQQGLFTFVNPAAERITGWTAAELIGRKVHDTIHHTRADGSPFPPAECPVHATLMAGEAVSMSGELFWRKDGRSFPVEYTATPLRQYGAVVGAVAVFRDIGERLKAEEQVRRERDFTRAIVDSLPGLFYAVDAQGRFRLWNRNLELVTGCADIGELNALDLFGGDDRVLIKGKIAEVFSQGNATAEAALVTRDGRCLPHFFTGQRFAGDGEPLLIGMAIDISERKRLEDALMASNRDLEAFAYVASHDLQEPLRMVTSFLNLLQRRYGGQMGAEADEFIRFAVDGAARMKRLIEDLLTYSRATRGGNPFAAVDMAGAFQAALLCLAAAVTQEEAEVTADPLPVVTGDASQLERLLQNLIGNALKYRRRDVAPVVHVSAERDGEFWRFSVRDNGIGIASEYYSRVFDIFQRLHPRGEYEGTGVGLAICKQVVEHHGGRIWVDSEPGVGSTFVFTLPAGMPAASGESP